MLLDAPTVCINVAGHTGHLNDVAGQTGRLNNVTGHTGRLDEDEVGHINSLGVAGHTDRLTQLDTPTVCIK